MITLNSLFRKKEQIVDRRIAGETILVPIRGNLADMERIFALNPVGEFIWERLDGKNSLETICRSITAEFAVDPAKAEEDMKRFIGELLDQALVCRV